MKWIIPLVFITAAVPGIAQQQGKFMNETSAFMTDAFGQPVYTQQKANWEGNIFYPANYHYATLTAAGGKVYRYIKTKINLLEGTVLFTDSTESEFVATLPIDKIEFEDFASGVKITFVKIMNDTGKCFYQLLDSGRMSLLKKIYVISRDKTTYGSTTITRVFEQKQSYFVYSNAGLVPLEQSKAVVIKVLSDKSVQVNAFIEQEKLKLRREEDLAKLFHYYNSLN
jgi:hypothetical protein